MLRHVNRTHAGAEDGAEAAGEDGVQEEQGGKRKDRRKDKKKGGKGEAAAANGHAAAAAAGGGEGEGGEGQLSARQRKRLKQKARVDQKKQLLKVGGCLIVSWPTCMVQFALSIGRGGGR